MAAKSTLRREKALGALPVLLMLFHAPFKISNVAAVAVAHESGHLRLQIAQHLSFKFIHHSHLPDSVGHGLSVVANPFFTVQAGG
jgi:hypothetical protein